MTVSPSWTVAETDDASFAALALPWLDSVYRFARSLTREEAAVSELVQETFRRAYQRWQTFDPDGDAQRWLLTICRETVVSLRPHGGRDLALVSNCPIDQLPERFRSALVLVSVEGQSYTAAAAILGVPVGALRCRLFRARHALKQLIA